MSEAEHEITDEVVKEAAANPNGWVYKIEGSFGLNDAVPPEAIVGAWEVDKDGKLTGKFVNNPRYRGNA